ncbi:MAG: hypothetical protein NT163_11045 [Chlorobiales bacterium]|nr:hypothetical protein [Chlorobiales bacterium]
MLRKVWQTLISMTTKGDVLNDESIMKLMYLAMQNIAKKWAMSIRD